VSILDFNASEIKTKIWENRKMIFILIVLFLFAMSIRSNIVRYERNYLFEPDAYYHARLIQDVVTLGHVPELDTDVYYQLGGMTHQPPSLYHYINAWTYNIITLGQYDKESLAFSVQFLPIIFGALISLVMYFLGKEVFKSKKLGIIAGFLTAISPAFAYRTMAGAQGDNSLGFLWMVIGFVFLIKALKSDSLNKTDLINSLVAGIFFALMVFTWRMNLLIPVVLIPAIFVILLYQSKFAKKSALQKSLIINTIIKSGIALGVYTIASYIYGENWIASAIGSVNSIIPLGITPLFILSILSVLVVIGLSLFLQNSKKEIKDYGFYIALIVLILGLIAMIYVFATVPDLFYGNGGRTDIGSLVGEESVGVNSFGIKYNALLILPFVGLFMLPLGMYLFKRKDLQLQIILWFWTLATLMMAWYKLKFTFVFGLGLVMGSLIAFDFFFKVLKKYDIEKGVESKITIVALLLIMIIGIAAAPTYLNQFQPFANQDTKWIDTMDWIEDNTDMNAKFFNWWGDGHQLAFVTERKYSSDNRNASSQANSLYAEFNITTDANRGYEIIKSEIGAEYIILASNNLYSGPSYEYYVQNKVDSSLGAKYYDFQTRIIGCSDANEGKICNGQLVPSETFNIKFSKNWKSTPTEFYNGQVPVFYYGENNSLIILGQTYNNTNLAKVYFNSAETSNYYEEVYNKSGIKIFKVK
jgi:asparagine N-glycosylation enzyme membrane subunit Stt3